MMRTRQSRDFAGQVPPLQMMTPRLSRSLIPGRIIFSVLGLAVLLASPPVHAGTAPGGSKALAEAKAGSDSGADLMELPLEELMRMEVTSVSKKQQPLDEAAAAIYVLTSDDLRRSGATNIPQALRMVPGLQVARIDANKWAITARGFNDRFANKLLVMVDGRSVYTQLFSGVFWETLDLPLELIDRIEVIRGTGASIWGANAVNGVINIITKPAGKTLGASVGVGVGTEEPARIQGIYGWDLGRGAQMRAHGFFADRAKGASSRDLRVDDSWQTGHAGTRLDWTRGPGEQLTLLGDLYRLRISSDTYSPSLAAPYTERIRGKDPLNGESALVRWSRTYAGRGEVTIQSYLEHYAIDLQSLMTHSATTLDLEVVNRLQVAQGQETMIGLEIRTIRDLTDSTLVTSLSPALQRTNLPSGFIQHEAQFLGSRAVATLGSRFEHYRASGWEVLPNARLLYHLTDRHAVYGAISQAVRTPSRADQAIQYLAAVVPPNPATPGAPAVLVKVEGNPAERSERVRGLDAGYRGQVAAGLLCELTAFDYEYRYLRSSSIGEPRLTSIDGAPFILVPSTVGNSNRAHASGFETMLDWQVTRSWRLTSTFSHLKELEEAPEGTPTAYAPKSGTEPANTWTLRSFLAPAARTELALELRHVDKMAGYGIPAYLVADARMGYTFSSGLSGAVIARNLLEGSHQEFVPGYVSTIPTKVRPSIGLQIEWHP